MRTFAVSQVTPGERALPAVSLARSVAQRCGISVEASGSNVDQLVAVGNARRLRR